MEPMTDVIGLIARPARGGGPGSATENSMTATLYGIRSDEVLQSSALRSNSTELFFRRNYTRKRGSL